ncbi:15765_t:CDS:10, partial [Cetraspora pellucida]
MNTQPILKAFYNDTAIEDWDLQKVADYDSEFEMTRKRKAREILDNWKRKLGLLVFSDEFLVRRLVQTGTLEMVYTEEKPEAFQWREYWEFTRTKKDDHEKLQKTPEHKIYSDFFVPPTTRSESDDKETDSDNFSPDKRDPKNFTVFFLDDSVAFDENDDGNPYMFQDKNISALFTSYRLNAQQMARESGLSIETDYHEILSLSHILLLQADNFSDLQIEQFSGDTLVDFHKHMRNTYIIKNKVAQSVKAIFRECIEIALDEDLGPKEAEKTLERSFTKSFDDPIDQKKFERMRTDYSCIFRKAIRSTQDTILYWYHFTTKYDKRIDKISVSNKVGKKKATSLVYREIKQLLPDITDANLCHIILKARKIRTLFSAVEVDKIKQVSYSANAISGLFYTQIQNIIEYVANSKSNSNTSGSTKLLDTKVSESATFPIYPTYIFNHLGSDDVTSTPTKSQVSDLKVKKVSEYSNENANYYGINVESLCPICKLNHEDEDGIKGEYKDGSYYIKCEASKSDTLCLTPKYLDWQGKLIGILTDKNRSKLYKRYNEETRLDPWINSETSESSQSESANNHLSRDYFFKYTDSEAKCPICEEVHTRLGIWDDWSWLGKNDHYYLNCPFRIDQKKAITVIQCLVEGVPNKSREVEPHYSHDSSIHPNKPRLYQYAVEHGMDPEKFSIVTEAEKNRWAMG